MTPVEELRQAAATARRLQEGVTAGPWWRSGTSIETSHECSPRHGCHAVGDTWSGKPASGREKADASHIAAWHPGVTVHMADAWEALADSFGTTNFSPLGKALLAAARAFNGSEQP